MKYVILLADGMADEPLPEYDNKTPIEIAYTPHFDKIAREGAMGLVKTVPDSLEPASDVANLSLLGYDPKENYTGRGPLEALSIGVPLTDTDIAYRCNLVTIENDTMIDSTAGHISNEEGALLIDALSKVISDITFYPGISYRNLLIVPNGKNAQTQPPHNIIGEKIHEFLPRGKDADRLVTCMEKAHEILQNHPINKARIEAGKASANRIWPWNGGTSPQLKPFLEMFGISGGVISGVDLLKGIAIAAGMKPISVPGATGYLDTDYMAKARYALDALKELDLVYVHVEAPDEAGHMGNVKEKILALERIDEMLGLFLAKFDGCIAVLPDHPTPLLNRIHTSDSVPFAIYGKDRDETTCFSEREAAKGKYGKITGPMFMPLLLQ
jgi:2,3-bisphosphoglycerate-independent phosphoglycerate mutase